MNLNNYNLPVCILEFSKVDVVSESVIVLIGLVAFDDQHLKQGHLFTNTVVELLQALADGF